LADVLLVVLVFLRLGVIRVKEKLLAIELRHSDLAFVKRLSDHGEAVALSPKKVNMRQARFVELFGRSWLLGLLVVLFTILLKRHVFYGRLICFRLRRAASGAALW